MRNFYCQKHQKKRRRHCFFFSGLVGLILGSLLIREYIVGDRQEHAILYPIIFSYLLTCFSILAYCKELGTEISATDSEHGSSEVRSTVRNNTPNELPILSTVDVVQQTKKKLYGWV